MMSTQKNTPSNLRLPVRTDSRPSRVVAAPGQLPPFWPRSVLFFSNIHRIFYENVAETTELITEIAGASSYGGRLLSILDVLFAGGDNAVFLESEPHEGLIAYLRDSLGLRMPRIVTLDAQGYDRIGSGAKQDRAARERFIEAFRGHPAQWIDGYVTDRTLADLALALRKETISTVAGSKQGNNKYLLHQHLAREDLPTFDTLVVSNREEVSRSLQRLKTMGYQHAVIKAQIGASGFGMRRLATDRLDLRNVDDYLFFEGPCMVQGWIDEELPGVRRVGSPSVQMFVGDETVYLFDMTEQVLSHESVHQGNIAPPPYLSDHPWLKKELLQQAAKTGSWLHEQGYRGTASTDFLVVHDSDGYRAIVCEVNARVTGATYPAVLARHFTPGNSWVMRNIRFRHPADGAELLSLMRTKSLLYLPTLRRGILPFNFNTAPGGRVIKGQFLFLDETYADCVAMLTHAESVLHVGWEYDRD